MSDGHTKNTAESGSFVGIQADEVHNSTVYQVLPGDPPEVKYQVGLRYLDDGVPSRARDLITEAITRNYENAEVRFHWVLAMLSKRSYRDLTAEERAQLARLPDHLAKYSDSEWKRALHAVTDLLGELDGSESDPSGALGKLKALPSQQRDAIVRHCDLVLTGGMKDHFWARIRREADRMRCHDDRLDRVWAYFHPRPAGPRARRPTPNACTLGDRFRTALSTTSLALAIGYLGWLVLRQPTPLPVIAYLAALAAGCGAAKSGFEWHYRVHRRRAKDREHSGSFGPTENAEAGFANDVDRSFRYYSHKYAPKGVNTDSWLLSTRSARAARRNEIVELYRESRIPIAKVNWLIRYVIRQVRKQWRDETLFEYRERYRTSLATKAWCFLCLAITAASMSIVVMAAFLTDPLPAVGAALIALVSTRIAAATWSLIMSERRRVAEEEREYLRTLEEREAEHSRWKSKLEATCPTENEMEAWLACDRALLIDEALRHYRLAWRDIIAHAIVQSPAKNSKQAHVPGGPWRYSKYDLHLFLITSDGVRELTRQLDFESASFHGHERGNFRFDAVSSLHVVKAGEYDYTIDLTLTNGPSRTIRVAEPEQSAELSTEGEAGLPEVSLDSAGFTHALHVLEGIAAEGKAWLERTDARKVPIDADTTSLMPLT
ncbi:hypothetical protein [Saccharopolyspora cebuensis]|uniref:Uncharacterized protein n=1 Tax=Saccharopolyspora cebuensis TaxID=418759 RepID=A0ABV4CE90_9PSEU